MRIDREVLRVAIRENCERNCKHRKNIDALYGRYGADENYLYDRLQDGICLTCPLNKILLKEDNIKCTLDIDDTDGT